MKKELPRFEGRRVQVGTLRLTGRTHEHVGALALEEEVYLIVRAHVAQVAHAEISVDGLDVFARIHTLKASALVLLDSGQGLRMLDEATMLADERLGIRDLFHQGDDE